MCTLEVVKFYEEQQSTEAPPFHTLTCPGRLGAGEWQAWRRSVCRARLRFPGVGGAKIEEEEAVRGVQYKTAPQREGEREICSPTAARFASKGPNLI